MRILKRKEIYQQASVHTHPHTHVEAHGGKDILKNINRGHAEIFVKFL